MLERYFGMKLNIWSTFLFSVWTEAKITWAQAPTPLTNFIQLRKTDPKIAQNQHENPNYDATEVEKK